MLPTNLVEQNPVINWQAMVEEILGQAPHRPIHYTAFASWHPDWRFLLCNSPAPQKDGFSFHFL